MLKDQKEQKMRPAEMSEEAIFVIMMNNDILVNWLLKA